MKNSIRRVAGALLGIGIVMTGTATFLLFTTACAHGSCNMAAVIFGIPAYNTEISSMSNAVSMSTPATLVVSGNDVTQSTLILGLYLVTLAFLILVVLEFFDAHYLKSFFRSVRRVKYS